LSKENPLCRCRDAEQKSVALPADYRPVVRPALTYQSRIGAREPGRAGSASYHRQRCACKSIATGCLSGTLPDKQLPDVAFACAAIAAVVKAVRDRSGRLVPIAPNDYDDLPTRRELDPRPVERLQSLGILYDRSPEGEYFHIYTEAFAERFLFRSRAARRRLCHRWRAHCAGADRGADSGALSRLDRKEDIMPRVRAGNVTLNYDRQGSGEPLVLIPYLAADCACYAFQVAEYAKHFTCISVDLRGTGESDKPAGRYSTEMFADDVAALMREIGADRAHVAGLSLGAATGMWLAAKYPERVKSLSVHSGWPKTDAFIQTVVEGWQIMAKAIGSVPEMVIQGIFPWCFTPELYARRPEYIRALSDFVRGRPAQPVEAFIQESDAVIGHDVESRLGAIRAPTLITFGRHDMVTSTRFAEALKSGIRNSELHIFEDCSHAPLYENVEAFNAKTVAFLKSRSG